MTTTPKTRQIRKVPQVQDKKKERIVAQYEMAWSLYSAGATLPAVLMATGLTNPELYAFVTQGVPGYPECPSFASRFGALYTEAKSRSREAAKTVGDASIKALRYQIQICEAAQSLVYRALADINNQSIKDGKSCGFGKVKGLREALNVVRALRPLIDFGAVANAFTSLYGTLAEASQTSIPRAVEIDALPAIVSLQIDASKSGDGGDIVSQLLPESAQWTDEEIDEYLDTGVKPKRAI